ncbi:MAG: aldo/keto reductase [bacterium]|nr:aldo/keto reductase [bacterium]
MPDSPVARLDHYRLLGRSGLRVSPLCMGTMTFGEVSGWGAPEDESRAMLEHYLERGGNFIDTANLYTQGTSETWLGRFLKGRRDGVVLGTKFTINMYPGDPNGGGNHRKSIVRSLEDSLRRLQTDYIDIYWLHDWEWRAPIDEVMRALDDLVRAGKILYLGISNMPAWKVAQANTMADLRGWSPFIAMQAEYSLVQRSTEREVIPMARELGLGLLPWSPLAGGMLTGKYNPADEDSLTPPTKPTRGGFVEEKINRQNVAIVREVLNVAHEMGQSPAQVALNWTMQRPGVTSIVLGARTMAHLKDNMGCLDFTLPAEQMRRLCEVSAFEPGYPHWMLELDRVKNAITGGCTIERRVPFIV